MILKFLFDGHSILHEEVSATLPKGNQILSALSWQGPSTLIAACRSSGSPTTALCVPHQQQSLDLKQYDFSPNSMDEGPAEGLSL
jgi:hypothetical protein